MIQYITAPLPFAGQKRRWLRQLEPIVRSLPPNTTFVDVFGGSGLVSRLCKDIHPTARVIYNDYDNYSERLRHIKETEQLRQEIVSIFAPPLYFSFCCCDLLILYFSFCNSVLFVFPILVLYLFPVVQHLRCDTSIDVAPKLQGHPPPL